jgi:anti-anti-sigma factor
MSFSVGLYHDFARKGGVIFRTLPSTQSSDYVSKPDGILSQAEAEHVSMQLAIHKAEGILSDCHLEVGKKGDLIVVRLGKHRILDEATVTKISDELLGVPDRPDCHRLLLDFSGVACLSSAMLAQLVRLHRKMESKGEKLRLCGLDSHFRSVFATTRLDRLFDITS